MTLFDFVTIAILLVSGAVGLIRGAAREVMTVIAFILAVAIAVLGLRFTGPIARHAIHPSFLATGVAILVVFAVAYILLRMLGAGLARKVRDTETLSTADRVIGVGFGLLRALVLLGVLYLVFNAATPTERVPPWIKNSATYPLWAASGHVLMTLEPQGSAVANEVGPALENAVRDGSADKSRAPASNQDAGYDEQSRRSVDELVEKAR